MEAFAYALSDAFYKLLFAETNGSEPILVADQAASNNPQRIFLVHYTMSGAGSGESSRPILKDELTGYEYGTRTTYPTQRVGLEELQATIEPSMYKSPEVQLVKANAENVLTKEKRPIKAIVSETLIERLAGLYRFAW